MDAYLHTISFFLKKFQRDCTAYDA